MKYSIAVIGATGNVGREILNILENSKVQIEKIFAVASQKSVGKEVVFKNRSIEVNSIEGFDFTDIDFVFFATNASISKKYVLVASKKVKLVIDLSSHFRMNEDIPLVVPEVNLSSLKLAKESHIVTNPNCVAIPLVVTLKNLHTFAQVSRIVVSTYQSVSGAGKKAMDDLYVQTKDRLSNVFSDDNNREKIAFNVIAKIDELTKTGYTNEEIKVMEETKKMLCSDIDITATCVRVPVFVGHSMSVNVEFSKNISVNEAYNILNKSEGVLTDRSSEYNYFTPVDCLGKDEVLVSRVRQDIANNILNLWIVSDNLRKGAAVNAVQIFEKYVEDYL